MSACSAGLHTLSDRVQVVCSAMSHVTCTLSESTCSLGLLIAQRWQSPHVCFSGLSYPNSKSSILPVSTQQALQHAGHSRMTCARLSWAPSLT